MGNWSWKERKAKVAIAVAIATLVAYYFLLPNPLFKVPYSTVVNDHEGELLSAAIASDGQWRFPPGTQVPDKYIKAVTLFEDKRFWYHPGIDPLSMARALYQNIRAGRTISGGSTITMQVVRLSRAQRSRTIGEKMIEMAVATRVEWSYTKHEIISLYAAHAPYGGNVVGLEAACWRYFGRTPDELSWAEAALLAVLPNNPSLINLGQNRLALQEKRNRLLHRLHQEGYLDAVDIDLALAEPLPQQPLPMPRWSPHLLDRVIMEGNAGQRIPSTLNAHLQKRTAEILAEHSLRYQGNQISNGAALIAEVATGNVLAYVGNVPSGAKHHDRVDVIRAPRSTGSILKPFLYAALQQEGKLLPKSLVPDIPTIIDGFAPKNFSRQYDGAVAADQALTRSLNIPAVHELRQYRYEKFHTLLKEVGITTLKRPPDHYGLSMILGGAEATLWDVAGAYASMARVLNNYFTTAGHKRYRPGDYHSLTYERAERQDTTRQTEAGVLSASSIWLTFEALTEVYRPGEESGWRSFHSSKRIAWKTGTSFGFRDGWAIGVTPAYVVAVWIGNADGEGRPGLTGTETAAPVLFDLFSLLPNVPWFDQPVSEMTEIDICTESGWRSTDRCGNVRKQWITNPSLAAPPCRNHQLIHLSKDHKNRVHADCEDLGRIISTNWFVLPPVEEYYYKPHHSDYQSLPPLRADCLQSGDRSVMDLIYPKWNNQLFLPRSLDGTPGEAVFQAVHRNPGATIFWHLDGSFVGSTEKSHKLPLSPTSGNHVLTLVDENGEVLERPFSVIFSN